MIEEIERMLTSVLYYIIGGYMLSTGISHDINSVNLWWFLAGLIVLIVSWTVLAVWARRNDWKRK